MAFLYQLTFMELQNKRIPLKNGIIGIFVYLFLWVFEPFGLYTCHHLIRMSGAYTATFTAFCVVNNPYFPDLIAWFAPGLLASILITRTVLHYKKKFKFAEVNN